MARRIRLTELGDPSVLRVEEFPDPQPPPDGYVVAVEAAGVNFADTLERRGAYRRDQALPCELGKEAAGVVVARGAEAHEFHEGDRVIVVKMDNGCYADRVAAAGHQVLPPPADFDFDEMAAFANTFATAWWAMHEVARTRPGESALIQAAAGGVGSAAVALARSGGLSPVIGTAGSAEKCAFVERLGADACLDYRTTDVAPALGELTGGRGIDYCLESVGGRAYEASLQALAPLGRLVVIGFSSIREHHAERIPRLHPLTLFHRSIAVAGLNMDHVAYTRDRATWRRLVDHVEEHGLRPVVGATFPLEEAARAHEALERRETIGKVLLRP